MVRLVPIDLGFGESGVDDIGIEGLIEWAYKSWPNFSRFVSKYIYSVASWRLQVTLISSPGIISQKTDDFKHF